MRRIELNIISYTNLLIVRYIEVEFNDKTTYSVVLTWPSYDLKDSMMKGYVLWSV